MRCRRCPPFFSPPPLPPLPPPAIVSSKESASYASMRTTPGSGATRSVLEIFEGVVVEAVEVEVEKNDNVDDDVDVASLPIAVKSALA